MNLKTAHIKTAAPVLTIFILGLVLFRFKASQDRIYKPYRTITVPKMYRVGHTASVLAFSPDSQRLLIADTHQRVTVWDIENTKQIQTFKHQMGDNVQAVSWNSQRVVVSNPRSFKVFSHATGKMLREAPAEWKQKSFQYQLDHYAQSVISADGSRVLFGQVHGAISLWNTQTGKLVWKLKAPRRQTCGLAISSDNRYIAVASLRVNPQFRGMFEGVEIALRQAHNGKLITTYSYDNAGIAPVIHFEGNLGNIALAFSPNSQNLAAVSTEGIKIWDLSTEKTLAESSYRGTPRWGGKKWASYSPDGRLIASVGRGQKVIVSSALDGHTTFEFQSIDYLCAVTVSHDGKYVAAGGQAKGGQGVVQIWSVQDL